MKKKKTGITRPRPDGGVKDGHYQTRSDGGVISRKKKTVITRPLPDGGVINEIQVDCSWITIFYVLGKLHAFMRLKIPNLFTSSDPRCCSLLILLNV